MRLVRTRPAATSAITVGLLACVTAMINPSARAQDDEIKGVKGTVIQPRLVDAKVGEISEQGTYEAEVGDLIELSYRFPVALPPPASATPKEVSVAIAGGAPPPVIKSPLGIRYVRVPGMTGGGQIRAFLVAQNPGKATVSFHIDKDIYHYKFQVSKK